MSGVDAGNARQWYQLLKEIAADFRGAAFKSKQERLDRYKALYDATRKSHVSYAKLLSDLLSDLLSIRGDTDLQNAKERFLQKRSSSAFKHYLTKHDAETYLDLTNDLAEKRFLASVVIYFCYKLDRTRYGATISNLDTMIWEIEEFGGDKGWNSASTYLWYEISDLNNVEEIANKASLLLEAVADRFSMIEKTFSELNGNWRHGQNVSASPLAQFFKNFPLLKQTSDEDQKGDAIS